MCVREREFKFERETGHLKFMGWVHVSMRGVLLVQCVFHTSPFNLQHFVSHEKSIFRIDYGMQCREFHLEIENQLKFLQEQNYLSLNAYYVLNVVCSERPV